MLAIGSDHGGFYLKQTVIKHLQDRGIDVKDFGTYTPDSCDYSDFAKPVAQAILDGECDRGILICGTGIGMSMAANRHPGIRAALCNTELQAVMARRHNDANVLCLGARIIGFEHCGGFPRRNV